jgi:hypothetical protein
MENKKWREAKNRADWEKSIRETKVRIELTWHRSRRRKEVEEEEEEKKK